MGHVHSMFEWDTYIQYCSRLEVGGVKIINQHLFCNDDGVSQKAFIINIHTFFYLLKW